MDEKVFIPKILLRGDKAEFLARVNQRPFNIVGQIDFIGEVDGQQFDFLGDEKFSIDGKLYARQELPQILKYTVDYIVFNSGHELNLLSGIFYRLGLYVRSQFISLSEFNRLPIDAFCDLNSDIQLLNNLKLASIKTLLDIDAHFAKSRLLTKGANDCTEIDGISTDEMLPIKENIYRHVYEKFSDCRLKRYDVALVYGRTSIDFIATFSALEDMTDIVITFVRYGADFENFIQENIGLFERIEYLESFAGRWFIFYRRKPPKDFAMYVVTHKSLPPEHVEKFPVGYKVIHAGRGNASDLGYLGDDTGENISHLNPYINELTALYWIWKHTTHSVVGISHYRRFFTESEEKPFTEIDDLNFAYEKILTQDAAEKLLQDYDIIVSRISQHHVTQAEDIASSVSLELASLVKSALKKNLVQVHPDCEKIFDYVMNSPAYYECHMFVTRKNIYDDYCRWLFSFILDTLNDILETVSPSLLQEGRKRAVGHFAERMFTVYLIRNRLRVKELNKMFCKGV